MFLDWRATACFKLLGMTAVDRLKAPQQNKLDKFNLESGFGETVKN